MDQQPNKLKGILGVTVGGVFGLIAYPFSAFALSCVFHLTDFLSLVALSLGLIFFLSGLLISFSILTFAEKKWRISNVASPVKLKLLGVFFFSVFTGLSFFSSLSLGNAVISFFGDGHNPSVIVAIAASFLFLVLFGILGFFVPRFAIPANFSYVKAWRRAGHFIIFFVPLITLTPLVLFGIFVNYVSAQVPVYINFDSCPPSKVEWYSELFKGVVGLGILVALIVVFRTILKQYGSAAKQA